MRKLALSALLCSGFLAILLSGSIAKGDELYGRIRGTVTDQSGGVVPGAKVTVTNESTGISRSMTSSSSGDFQFVNLLAPSVYDVEAEKEGFRKYQATSIHLDINQVYVANVILEVGSSTQTVTVEANVAQINTTQMQLGTAVTATTIEDMPLNGRNWIQLQELQPGVVGASDRLGIGLGGTNFATNGSQSQQNSFYVNGLDIADVALNAAGLTPSPDAIAEFQMVTSTINPEFGRNSGAVMNAVIKGGTNQLHGDGFEFFRDKSLDAANSLTNILSPYHQNQFGATVGGPVLLPHIYNGRDKTFFFFSYQGLRNVAPQAFSVPTVYSNAERGGNFSDMGGFPAVNPATGVAAVSPMPMVDSSGTTQPAGTPYATLFPTGQIPTADLNPLALKLMNQYVPPSNGASNAYNFAPTVSHVDDEYIARIDQSFGGHDSIWGYWLWERNPTLSTLPFQGSTLPGFGETDGFHAQQYAIAWNHAFSPTTLNEARFGYFRFNYVAVYPQTPINPTAYGFTGINPESPSVASIPAQFVAGLFNLGFSIYGPQPRLENTYQVIDNFSKIVGRHTIKAGFTNDRFQVYNPFDLFNSGLFLFSGAGTYSTGLPGADFLLGLPDIYIQGNGAVINARSREYYSYVQDQFKLRPNLTLTFGTGWDIETPYLNLYDKGELVNAFRPGVQSKVFPLAPTGVLWPGDPGINSAGGVTTHYKDFAPRIGFAWSPDKAHKWSVHAGYGIYFNRTEEEVALQNLTTPPFSITSYGVGNIGGASSLAAPYTGWCGGIAAPAPCSTPNLFPYTPPTSGNVSFAALEPVAINTLSPNFGVPMAQNYNLTVERQVTDSMTVTVAYVGSQGRHLEGNYELNPAGSAAGNPAAAALGCNPSNLDSCAPTTFPYNPSTTGLGAINYQATDFNSNYNSLQISVNQRFKHGLTFLAAYTWSRNFDYNSTADNQDGFVPPGINPFNFKSMYGPSNNDAPQRFVFSYDYTLPFYHFAHRLRPLTDGWKLVGIVTFQSGFPVEIADTAAPSLTCNPADFAETIDVPCWDRPNRVQGVGLDIGNPRTYNIGGKTHYWFNPAAFAHAPSGMLGNAGRNPFYGPGINNFDTSLIKDIHFTESKYIELRGETFNTFNHQQWGPPVNGSGLDIAPVADINSGNFGRITSVRGNFVAQLGAKIYF
jgi:hypothetical protein